MAKMSKAQAIVPEPTFKGKTAAQWRTEAADSRKREQESWDRSDTDGFLSQWALSSMAREYELCAQVAETGGTTEVQALFFLDGTIAATEMIAGRFGAQWLLDDAAARRHGSRWYSPSRADKSARRRANNAKKGFMVGTIQVAADVKMVGGNITSVRPIICADEAALRDGAYTVVAADDDPTDH